MRADMTCTWCEDRALDHRHYAVSISDRNGHWIGRLTPQGYTTRRKVHASVMSKATAERIAAEIQAAGEYNTKTILF